MLNDRPVAAARPVAAVLSGQRLPIPPLLKTRAVLLPILSLVLVLLFVSGLVLALRSSQRAAGSSRSPTAMSAVQPVGTAAPPLSAPTEQLTAAPTASDTAATSPTQADPLAQLRTLIEQGIAAGQAGPNGAVLSTELDAVSQALAAGNRTQAIAGLGELQNMVRTGAVNGTINVDFALQVLTEIDTVLVIAQAPPVATAEMATVATLPTPTVVAETTTAATVSTPTPTTNLTPTSVPKLRIVRKSQDEDPTCVAVQILGISTDQWTFKANGINLPRASFDNTGNARLCGLRAHREFTFNIYNAEGGIVPGGEGISARGGDVFEGDWQ